MLNLTDIEAAADTILSYLGSQGGSPSEPAKTSSNKARIAGGTVTPSGKRFLITELWQHGSPQPALVRLSFHKREPHQESRGRWSVQDDGIIRIDRRAAVQEFQNTPTFHLLLSGHQTPTSPRVDGSLRARGQRREIAATVYAKRRRRKPEEDEEVKHHIDWDARNRPHPHRNLVAGEKDRELLFLQLAIYAARDGQLNVAAKEDVFADLRNGSLLSPLTTSGSGGGEKGVAGQTRTRESQKLSASWARHGNV